MDIAAVAVAEPFKEGPQAGALEPFGFQKRLHECAVLQRELGQRAGLAGELLGVFEGTLEDEPRHRVDVHGGHVAAQAHGFERNGAAARKRVQHLGRTPSVGFADFFAEPLEIGVILTTPMEDAADRFLLHLLNRAAVDALAFDLFDHTAGHALQERFALFGVSWVGKQGCDQRRP